MGSTPILLPHPLPHACRAAGLGVAEALREDGRGQNGPERLQEQPRHPAHARRLFLSAIVC
jgi:hypothetical protein